jgi:hypothetical protein
MKIENLSKELDTETMTAVRGGTSQVGQVVPTANQVIEQTQTNNILAHGPVALANDQSASNDASQPSYVPVGSLLFPFYG